MGCRARLTPASVEAKIGFLQVSYQESRQRIGVPVETRTHAILHSYFQFSRRTTRCQCVGRVVDVKIVAPDDDMIVQRLARERVFVIPISPSDKAKLVHISKNFVEVDPFAHCDSAFSATRGLASQAGQRKRHANPEKPCPFDFFAPDVLRIDELSPHLFRRRIDSDCSLDGGKLVRQGNGHSIQVERLD